MPRVTFDSIFTHNADGSLEPRQRIRVGGVEFGPGVHFTRGVSFAGIDFFNPQVLNHDLEVNIDNGVFVVVGIY